MQARKILTRKAKFPTTRRKRPTQLCNKDLEMSKQAAFEERANSNEEGYRPGPLPEEAKDECDATFMAFMEWLQDAAVRYGKSEEVLMKYMGLIPKTC